MPSSTPCLLSIDPPGPGDGNMAVDEVLLEWAAETGGCWWRFYQWAEPTLSLGYFQQYAERAGHAASRAVACTRRLTGGGAIVHQRELTYSLVVPAGQRLALARDRLYAMVHQSLIATLADRSIAAALHAPWAGPPGKPRGGVPGPAAEPFLCFQRRAAGDVVVGPAKIAGSAQRRRRGAVLQHGSILLGQSPAAPELPGIAEITATRLSPPELIAAWLPRLAAALALTFQRSELTAQQQRQAAALAESRYAADAWVRRRGR